VTTGWDATRRVQLDPPWDSFWVERYVDPPIGDLLALADTAAAAIKVRSTQNLDATCAALRRLIAAHNLTDRAGRPIEISFESLTYSLLLSVVIAVQSTGESAVPKGKKASSPAPSSRRQRSPSASGSSSPPVATA
jgi:hypothetical protein